MHTICHIEFEVTDLERSQAFFQGLFGWNFKQFMETMVVFYNGETYIGGLMKVDKVSPGGSPSIWFDVESIDEMIEKAKSLGSSVLEPKSEVPTVGWSAVVSDPDGSRVGMVEFKKP